MVHYEYFYDNNETIYIFEYPNNNLKGKLEFKDRLSCIKFILKLSEEIIKKHNVSFSKISECFYNINDNFDIIININSIKSSFNTTSKNFRIGFETSFFIKNIKNFEIKIYPLEDENNVEIHIYNRFNKNPFIKYKYPCIEVNLQFIFDRINKFAEIFRWYCKGVM